jgi:hypothetical protein
MNYIVDLYAEGEELAGDCLPDFYPTREAAIAAAEAEIARVAAIPRKDPALDWAVRYTLREVE